MKVVITLLDRDGNVTRQSEIDLRHLVDWKATEEYERVRKNGKATITKKTIHF